MPYLNPYRHEIRKLVKPIGDVINSQYDQTTYKQLDDILDELEQIIAGGGVQVVDRKEAYLETRQKCDDEPRDITHAELAESIAILTEETKTDILGHLIQYLGQTDQNDWNQYFTPANVADYLCRNSETTQHYFDPPTPNKDNVSGQAGLGLFSGANSGASEQDQPTAKPDGGAKLSSESSSTTLFFDPACGSGRLLLAGARITKDAVVLGWELSHREARMSAITLALAGYPGWIVSGNTLRLSTRDIYRISPEADKVLQVFQTGSWKKMPRLPSERDDLPADTDPNEYFDPALALESNVDNAEDCMSELDSALRRGADQTVGNPPFDTCNLENQTENGARRHEKYDTARRIVGDHSTSMKKTQRLEWLFIELAMEFTHTDGAVAMIVPEARLANPSDKDEREWMMNNCILSSSVDIPVETFQPETGAKCGIISFRPKRSEHVGLRLDYEVFMAIAESMGHDSHADGVPLTEEGETAQTDTDKLPPYYAVHGWIGEDTINVPDDDLYQVSAKHRSGCEKAEA